MGVALGTQLTRDAKVEQGAATARPSAVQAHANDELHRQVLDSLFAFVAVLTPEGAVVEINRAPLEASGLTLQDVVGQPFPETYWWAYSPEVQGKVSSALEAARKGDKPRFSAWIRMEGGKLTLMEFTVSALRGSNGAVEYLIPSGVDITERRRAEELLRLSETRYRNVVEGVAQLVWTCMPESTRCDYFNSRWAQYAGNPPVSDGLLLWFGLVHPDERQGVTERWLRSKSSGEPFEADCRIRSTSGEYRWFKTRALPLRDADGQILKWFGTCTDIDEERRLSGALMKREQELAATNDELRQFAYAVSHDLKEPLRTISAYTQLLQETIAEQIGEEARLYMNHIVEGSGRLHALLEDLREYMEVSSVPAGADRDRSTVNFEDVFQMVVRNLEAQIRDSNAVITRDPLPKVVGHRVHLLQLLQNLVSNAIKYRGAEPPRIHISALRHDRFWRISVRDNGIGIDAQHHQRVFGLFKRLHGRKFQGTGIGLSICQKVVERYGGRIWVESVLGKGSTFIFTLPAANGAKAE